MSNELQTATTTGSTVYAIIRNGIAQAWNGTTFEAFLDAHWSAYKVPLTEQGVSGYFVANFPALITQADTYGIEFYSGSGTEADAFIAGGSLLWNGSASSYAPSGTNLVSLSYVKDYLNISVTTYDGYLTNRIAAASAEVVSYCSNNFVSQNYTEVLDGPGSMTLLLSNRPVTGVTSVTLDYGTTVPTVIPGNQITVNSKSGTLSVTPGTSTYQSYFGYGIQNIQVVYAAGFSSIPVDVQEACAKIVANKYVSRASDMTMMSERIGDYQYNRRSDGNRSITPDIEAALFHYREIAV